MTNTHVRRKSVLLVLVGVLSMVSALFVLAQPASAHSASIEASVECTQTGDLKLNWRAFSFSPEGPFGLHPDIVVDFTTDTGGTDILVRGAFTDENGRQLKGSEILIPGTTTVQVRVTPAPGVKWSNSDETGGADAVTVNVPPELQVCSETGSGGEPTPTPEEPTPVPTEEPTPVPTEEPTPVPTEEPTATPTEEPTTVVGGPEPQESPTSEVRGRTETRSETLAETGVESVALAIAGITLLLGGAMVTFHGLSLARRRD